MDIGRIESLPLNGRQFANLAATIPGVGLGFHSDPTKSTQYSPQINGGNGRNVNYQIDGGDNNDDTVGGLLQLFPLEAIQEFNVITSRSKAEYGRSNGGVMNIVTKSGTNAPSGSFFTLFRDTAMNAHHRDGKGQRRREAGLPPLSVRRLVRRADRPGQGALLRGRRADAAGHVPGGRHRGAVPGAGWHLRDAIPRNAADREGHGGSEPVAVPVGALRPQPEYTAVRREPANPSQRMGHQRELLQLVQRQPQLGARRHELNEFIFQYADFRNHIGANSHDPYQLFPNGVAVGQSPEHAADDASRRSGSSATTSPGRLPAWAASATTSRPGVNFINEPRLFITFNSGKGVLQHNHLTDDVNGPLSIVTMNDGDASANIPLKQYAFYFQDDWRVTDR